MKLFAQIGHGLGDKVINGLSEGLIDGAIFSPKDLQQIVHASDLSGGADLVQVRNLFAVCRGNKSASNLRQIFQIRYNRNIFSGLIVLAEAQENR